MALSKKQAKEISELICALSCYESMVHSADTCQDLNERYKKKCDAMRWHDEAAGKLTAMGIYVRPYM